MKVKPNEVIDILNKRTITYPDSIVIDLEKSQGSWVVDKRNGRQYLDCSSQYASQALGWNNPKMIAQKDRLLKAALHKVANPDNYTVEYAEFVKTFSEITKDFKYYFYICGGAIAVENALKTAFDWKLQKLGQTDKFANKLQVLYLKESFHGRSGYTMSITSCNNLIYNGFPRFNWKQITNPKVWHDKNGADEIRAKNLESMALQEAETELQKNKVAAIIIEPIQGQGGDNHFRTEFLINIKKLTDKYESLLIFDEVQTGLGLTGKMWAYEHSEVVPDILCFGKKVQVSGICVGKKIDQVKDNVFKICGRIDSTWGGNLVDMVRSTMQIEIIQEDDLVENAKEVGDYFLEKIKELESSKLLNIRGKGLMIAFDFAAEQERDDFIKKINENMLLLPCGKKSVRFRPHLDFSKLNADEAVRFIKNVL